MVILRHVDFDHEVAIVLMAAVVIAAMIWLDMAVYLYGEDDE